MTPDEPNAPPAGVCTRQVVQLFAGQQHVGDRYCGYCGAAMFWKCPSFHSSPLWAGYCLTCGVARPSEP
jgi:hypothetical protein